MSRFQISKNDFCVIIPAAMLKGARNEMAHTGPNMPHIIGINANKPSGHSRP